MKKSKPTISHPDALLLARQIAERLFMAGNGERANRLILADITDRDLGGWCKDAVVKQAMQAIEESFAVVFPEPDYRKQLRKMCGLMATTQKDNEHRWMELACQFLNECLAVLGDKDRLTYSSKYGCFEVVTK